MQSKTEVILIRHGETEWNLSGRWQGHADSPLSARGIEQAEALGKRMLNEQLDCFYSSDLERARHTSRLVGGPSEWNPEFMESLRERDLGVLEGLTTDEMKVKCPQEYKSFRNNGPEYQVPGGESFSSFMIAVREHLRRWQPGIPAKKSEWLPMADFWVLSSVMS